MLGDDKIIEQAILNTKASMDMEGFEYTEEEIKKLRNSLINRTTREEMIEKALKNVGISKIQ